MVKPKDGTTVERRVDFPEPFASAPTVLVNTVSSVPNNPHACAGNIDARGFSVFCYREGNTETRVAWAAIGR